MAKDTSIEHQLTAPHNRIAWAFEQSDLDGPAKAVLLAMAYKARYGVCICSVPTIARLTSLGCSTVSRAIVRLIERGTISKAGTSKAYWTMKHRLNLERYERGSRDRREGDWHRKEKKKRRAVYRTFAPQLAEDQEAGEERTRDYEQEQLDQVGRDKAAWEGGGAWEYENERRDQVGRDKAAESSIPERDGGPSPERDGIGENPIPEREPIKRREKKIKEKKVVEPDMDATANGSSSFSSMEENTHPASASAPAAAANGATRLPSPTNGISTSRETTTCDEYPVSSMAGVLSDYVIGWARRPLPGNWLNYPDLDRELKRKGRRGFLEVGGILAGVLERTGGYLPKPEDFFGEYGRYRQIHIAVAARRRNGGRRAA